MTANPAVPPLPAKPVVDSAPGLQDLLSHAMAQLRAGRLDAAAHAYEGALRLCPDHPGALHMRGVVELQRGHFDGALAWIDRALETMPDWFEALNHRGIACHQLGRLDDALTAFDRAIRARPDAAQVHHNRAHALAESGSPEAALPGFDTALRLKPDYLEAHFCRANALQALGRPEEALDAYDQVLRLQPNHVAALNNQGIAWQNIGDDDRALASFERALIAQPGYASACYNLGLQCLRRGRFVEGWAGYAHRWNSEGFRSARLTTTRPPWDPDKPCRRVLIWAEQGIGDQILFSQCLSLALERIDSFMVAVDERLLPLFRRAWPMIDFRAFGTPIHESDFDTHLPMADWVARCIRSQDDVMRLPYPYLKADAARSQSLREHLGPDGRKIIGISWRSNHPRHGRAKSMPLQDLAPLLRQPDARFVNLQYGDVQEEISAASEALGVTVTQVANVDLFHDLEGLAALIEVCDRVVTTSNSTAHFAGATGKPTALLLPIGSGRLWYWHDQDGPSLWYPSIHRMGQKRRGEWQSLATQVAEWMQGEPER